MRRTLAVGLSLSLLAAPALAGAQAKGPPFRVEKDLLGEKQVPADAYYGVQTARALENFQISGITLRHFPELVKALALVKLAAVSFDQTGTTRIGKFLVNHSFMRPGLVATIASTATAVALSSLLLK